MTSGFSTSQSMKHFGWHPSWVPNHCLFVASSFRSSLVAWTTTWHFLSDPRERGTDSSRARELLQGSTSTASSLHPIRGPGYVATGDLPFPISHFLPKCVGMCRSGGNQFHTLGKQTFGLRQETSSQTSRWSYPKCRE